MFKKKNLFTYKLTMIRCANNIRLKILTYMCIHVYVKKQIGGGD